MKSKVEEYIQGYTRMCSNECHIYVGDGIMKFQYTPWLTPDHARAVAKIAREAVIEKAVEWLKENAVKYALYDHYDEIIHFDKKIYKDFKRTMRENSV